MVHALVMMMVTDWDELKPTYLPTAQISYLLRQQQELHFLVLQDQSRLWIAEKDGTSMATPIASGIVALVQANPSLDAFELWASLEIPRSGKRFQ